MKEIKISLQSKQREFKRCVDTTPVTFYGGAKGGGKSKGLRYIMLLRRFEYPGSHGAIFRKSFPELDANHIRPLLEEFPFLKEYWHDSKKILTLPNGSTLQFCHCSNEQDVDLHQGKEFHDLAIDEAGQWTENMFRKLQGSNRSSKKGIAARAILTGNPGGIGHAWLKRLFIDRKYNERERPEDYTFIQALVYDNPALIENDPDYVHRLNSEPNEVLRRAYRDGDWDIFAGQFFTELRRDVHIIKSFDIPKHWYRFGAYDYGFNHPAAFGWFASDEDGNVYVYRTLIKAGLRVDQFANRLNEYSDTKDLQMIIGGLDCWAQKRSMVVDQAAPTIAEEFENHGITLTRAAVDRIQGATNLRRYLAWQETLLNKPKLFIFDNEGGKQLFDCLSRMIHDPDRLEDVLKQDAVEGDITTGDDAYDMLRYALMSRPLSAEKPKEYHRPGTSKWAQEQEKRMEDSINEQARRQEAEENQADFYNIINSDLNPGTYYVNKRKGA